MIDVMLAGWFVLTALSVVYVAWYAFTRSPQLTLMKWGWVLVTLYTGPVGAALYVLSCQEPAPGTHETFVKPLWKQGLGSTIHCLAGDATGVIAATVVTSLLAFPTWLDVTFEYLAAFVFGLFIFQALFMRRMLGGSYLAAVRASFLPEWLSMNGVMAGMIPVMTILMSHDPSAQAATSPRFWGVMSLATLAGGIIAYPINVWLVAHGLKHGMGTVHVLGHGGHPLAAEPILAEGAVAAGGAVPASPPMRMTGEHGGMTRLVTRPQLAAMTVLTLLVLAAGVLVADVGGGFTTTTDDRETTAWSVGAPGD